MSSPCTPVDLSCGFLRRKKLATVSGRAGEPCLDVLLCFSSRNLFGDGYSSRSPLGVLPSCCPIILLALFGHLGVFAVFSFPHPFVLCCPPRVL